MKLPNDAVVTAFGRQALSLIAQELRARTITSLLAPDYYCPTMVLPFTLEGISVRFVETDTHCLMVPAALRSALARSPRSAVLHCETFGNQASAALADVLQSGREAGSTLIIDRTHSWPHPLSTKADYVTASLRKLLPVTDGAFVTGLGQATLVPSSSSETTRAIAARRRYLDRPSIATFEDAEDAADQAWVPAPPSTASMRLVDGLDECALFAKRRHVMQRLARALAAHQIPWLKMLNPPASGLLALRHHHADQIMDDLATHGVFPPVYWGKPRHLAPGHGWRTDIFTIPLDHTVAGREDRVADWICRAATANCHGEMATRGIITPA
ncbi:hypothetical protein [Propionimicrobium sp. PCR01-08-3]|uniref:hypothetical protein n=1 Tax=Propionimicrobium sp. PCR01-08-3 TaxID=3052086 RepID=UPI00255CD2A0|nr:hypothetical protein [Propionimicrobium sp. PCR01-08-3]WIY83690.1 hypothetical protein QQ658_04870 [Propionimicrobium sp. PCR01-08-3]